MRKYITHSLFLLLLLSLTLISCKKSFLEVTPKGDLVAQTYNDYNLLMNGQDFYAFYGVGIWQSAMLMGDDVSAEENIYNAGYLGQARQHFQYDADIFVESNNPYFSTDNPLFLQRLLQNLYPLNKIITEVNGATGGTTAQKQELIAEAMSARAYTNFQLINYFAQPYSANSAASNPGFPIITTADITVKTYQRGTEQEMYDFIIKDLTSAIPNLYIQSSFPTRWSKPAAEAFLGKVYLSMGKYADALTMFNNSFSDMAKMSSPPQFYNYNQTLAAGGSFLPIDPVNGPIIPFNNSTDVTESLLAVFSASGFFDGQNFGSDFLTIDPKTQALFDPSDLRLNLYTQLQDDQTPIPGGRMRRYFVNYSSFARVGIELPDLYLMSAEVKARNNDLSGAVADVETLRKNRMPAANASVPTAIAGNQTSLIKFIIDERKREFAGLGYRWFDMRRLANDPIFSGQSLAVHNEYLTNGGITPYPLTAARLTLRIPALYLKANPGMVDNP